VDKTLEREMARSECRKRALAGYLSRPECPRYVTSSSEEDLGSCRINWEIQSDDAEPRRNQWFSERQAKVSEDC